MCKCTPEIRTPFCGRGDCLPPGYANLGEWLGIFSDAEAEAAVAGALEAVTEGLDVIGDAFEDKPEGKKRK